MQTPMMDGDHDPGESTHCDDPRSRLQELQQRKKANAAFAELVEVIDDGEAGDADGSYIDSRVSLMHIVGSSAANLTPMLPIESGGLHDSHRISTESAFINARIIIAYIDLLGTWLNNRSAILRPFVLQ